MFLFCFRKSVLNNFSKMPPSCQSLWNCFTLLNNIWKSSFDSCLVLLSMPVTIPSQLPLNLRISFGNTQGPNLCLPHTLPGYFLSLSRLQSLPLCWWLTCLAAQMPPDPNWSHHPSQNLFFLLYSITQWVQPLTLHSPKPYSSLSCNISPLPPGPSHPA